MSWQCQDNRNKSMIFSGRGNTAHASQGEFKIKKNGIKYLSQSLTDKSPNVVYCRLFTFFEMALKIMYNFSKQRKELVCFACPKSYALTTAKSLHSSLWYYLRVVHSIVRPDTAYTTTTANTTAEELSLARQLQEYLNSTRQPYRQPQDTYLWQPEKRRLG